MANATILNSVMVMDGKGQAGFKMRRITAAWPTTAATCTLPVPGFSQVDAVSLVAVGAPASDEDQYWNDTLVGGLVSMNAANPVINLGRTGASPTSALKFCALVYGR